MGYRVAIVDTDTNASSVRWSGMREVEPNITVIGLTDSEALRKNIQQLHKDYDLIVIDGTPSLSRLVSTIIERQITNPVDITKITIILSRVLCLKLF